MKYRLLFLILAVICSCDQDKKITNDLTMINIDPSKVEEPYDISGDIEAEWDIVALETTDNSLISSINNVIYKNDIYYVLDKRGTTVFLFDSTGKFISKLYKKGNGPDEYSELDDFCLDGKNIWISDANMRFLVCYDENFKIIERFRTFDILGADHIAYFDGNIYMAGNWNNWNKKNVQFAAYNIQDKKVKDLWYVPALNNTILTGKASQIAKSDSSLLFIHSYCDTIFELKGKEFAPKYRTIFSENYKDVPLPIEKFMEQHNAGIIQGINDIKQTANKIYMQYVHKDNRYAIYDKRDGICKVYPHLINSNLSDLKIYVSTTYFDDEKNMISVHDSDAILETFGKDTDRAKIKNEADRKKIETIMSSYNEYSNPVIIKYKLKQNSGL